MVFIHNNKNRLFSASLWLGLFLCCNAALATEFKMQEIAEGVFVHPGQHVDFEAEGHDDIANIGFIVGKKCIAVIDTGGSLAVGQQLLGHVKEHTALPVCYVISTHVHFDHVLGNAVFKDANTKFIGHYRLAEELENSTGFFLEEYADELGGSTDPGIIIKPDIAVEDTLEIDLGDRILLIKAYPPAHSRTDLSIYDKNTGTLWLSDLLFVERIPALDGSLKGWLNVMEELKTSDARHVIPGHGRSNLAIQEAMQPQYEYLRQLLDETRQMLQQGAFMEDVIDQVANEEKLKWQLHEQHHKRNVSNAFIELEWE